MILLETVFQDLKFGIRMMTLNLGSTVVTTFALAVGIGVCTTVFTAYKAMVARPLDARAPDELVNLALTRDSGATQYRFSYPDYLAYRDSFRSIHGLIAFRPARVTVSNAGSMISQRDAAASSPLGRLALLGSGAGNAEFASVFVVSENYFGTLGVSAIQGHTFESMSPAELASNPSVLLSENYWQRRFGGDPAIVGKTIHLNG